MVKILISGASGFIGRPLISSLNSQGHIVVPLVRKNNESHLASVSWNPQTKEANREDFEGFDIVIHLAGEPLSIGRWTLNKQRKIVESRVKGTTYLSQLLREVQKPPKLFISASAVGFYGDRGDDILSEKSSQGSGFLSDVVGQWENGSRSLEDRGIRTVHMRFGMVLGKDGGALPKMVSVFRLGLGANIGSGKQWISWIALEDLIRSIHHIIHDDSLHGAVNLTSPQPVRQEEFASILAKQIHRFCIFSIPSWIVRLIFGNAASELLLSSCRALPTKLLSSGFRFTHPDLGEVISANIQKL